MSMMSSDQQGDIAPARQFNRQRLTLALNVARLTGPECDRVLGVAGPRGGDVGVVDAWEAGRLVPTDAQVAVIAEKTGRTVEFFYGPKLESKGAAFLCGRGAPKGLSHMVVDPDSGRTEIL